MPIIYSLILLCLNVKEFKLKSGLIYTSICFIITGFLASCMKIEEDERPNAAVSLVNAFDGKTADFFIDHEKQNTEPAAFSKSTPYFETKWGYRTLTVTESGTMNPLMPDGDAGFSPGRYYSLFLTKNTPEADDSVAIAITLDSLYAPAAGRARFRFANMTYTAPAVDIYIKGDTIPILRNQAFKSVSLFKSVNPARRIFQIYEAGNKIDVKLEFQVNLEAGKIYTVFTKGQWGTSGFGTAVVVNK